MLLHKDEILDRLAGRANVAQFVAFRPDKALRAVQTFLRICGREPNQRFFGAEDAITALLAASGEGRINVRSYLPAEPRSREFIYGLTRVDDAISAIDRLTSEGLHTIANETIDVSDGGVSGVLQGNTMEFAPDDTPRCVEKPGVVSLSCHHGMTLLRTVYGFEPELEVAEDERLEFSIHPLRRGWRRSHTLVWEHELEVPRARAPALTWPNNFSRFIGDKAFGLLIGDMLGAAVPRTLVIGRRVAAFEFGRDTGVGEVWTRTCPAEPQPGLFTTVKGWVDPFALLQAEDPTGKSLASLLRQAAVPAEFSGAALIGQSGLLTIEGVRGEGDRLMLGLDRPEPLPVRVTDDVTELHQKLCGLLGPVRMEWVHDGTRLWLIQLHLGATQTAGSILVPGHPERWVEFPVALGLERLRDTLLELPHNTGIVLLGQVGVTSHMADLVRRTGAPARLALGG